MPHAVSFLGSLVLHSVLCVLEKSQFLRIKVNYICMNRFSALSQKFPHWEVLAILDPDPQ